MSDRKSEASLGRLAEIFFRIGNTTFGGGFVTMGMLGRELVEGRRWLSSDQYELAFALSRVTPGTNLIAFCAAIGALLKGNAGAIVAVLALTIPSAAIAVGFIYGFERWQSNPYVAAALVGTVAAVAGMMWSTIYTILRPHVGGIVDNLRTVVLAGGAFLASWMFGVSPLVIIIAGTLIGLVWLDKKK